MVVLRVSGVCDRAELRFCPRLIRLGIGLSRVWWYQGNLSFCQRHFFYTCMTIEPILQPKTTQGIKRRVGFLNFSRNDTAAVIPVTIWELDLRGKIFEWMGLIELSKALFLQKG
jgi:hypothetical protein